MKDDKKLTAKKILKIIESNKHELNRLSVKKLGLFGSYSRGENKKNSDLDFLVIFKHKSFDNYMDLKFLLEDTFKKKIDLVIEEDLKSALKYVKNEAIYAKV